MESQVLSCREIFISDYRQCQMSVRRLRLCSTLQHRIGSHDATVAGSEIKIFRVMAKLPFGKV